MTDDHWLAVRLTAWCFVPRGGGGRNLASRDLKRCKCCVSCTAVGCADVDAPAGGWVKRSSAGEALFGCSDRLQTWKLRCRGDQWIGIRHNCTRGRPKTSMTSLYSQSQHFYGAMLFTASTMMYVHLSVCHTPVCVETAQHVIKLFSPQPHQLGPTVFLHQTILQYSDVHPLMGASNAGGIWKNRDVRPKYRFISEMIRDRTIVTV